MIALEQIVKTENELKKEYLGQYRKHVQRIKRIESDLEEIRSMKCYPSMNIDGMPRGTNNSDLSGYAALLDEKESELIREKYLRIKSYNEINAQINLVENETERDLLHYKYIKGLTWWEVAEKINYTERWTYQIHGKALKNFKLPKEFIEIQ